MTYLLIDFLLLVFHSVVKNLWGTPYLGIRNQIHTYLTFREQFGFFKKVLKLDEINFFLNMSTTYLFLERLGTCVPQWSDPKPCFDPEHIILDNFKKKKKSFALLHFSYFTLQCDLYLSFYFLYMISCDTSFYYLKSSFFAKKNFFSMRLQKFYSRLVFISSSIGQSTSFTDYRFANHGWKIKPLIRKFMPLTLKDFFSLKKIVYELNGCVERTVCELNRNFSHSLWLVSQGNCKYINCFFFLSL